VPLIISTFYRFRIISIFYELTASDYTRMHSITLHYTQTDIFTARSSAVFTIFAGKVAKYGGFFIPVQVVAGPIRPLDYTGLYQTIPNYTEI